MNLEVCRQIFEKYSDKNFMKICPVGAELFHADRLHVRNVGIFNTNASSTAVTTVPLLCRLETKTRIESIRISPCVCVGSTPARNDLSMCPCNLSSLLYFGLALYFGLTFIFTKRIFISGDMMRRSFN